MATAPKDIKINVAVDTTAIQNLKQLLTELGESLSKTGSQMAETFKASMPSLYPSPTQKDYALTPQQIADAYGVPESVLGLSPAAAVLDETHTFIDSGLIDSAAWKLQAGFDTEVLPMDECPANTSPYVPGQLGASAMLVSQQPTGWQTKTTAEIIADLQAAATAYKPQPYATGGVMPKKVFPAKEPDPSSPTAGIPAHAVFTSELIHSQAEAQEKAQQVLKAHGVSIAPLDEYGNPTGPWVDAGSAMDFTLSVVPDALTDAHEAYKQKMTQQVLKAQAAHENEVLGTYLGVDIGPESGNTVTVATATADPYGGLQITVTGPDGTPVHQATVPQKDVYQLMDAAMTGAPPEAFTWAHDWQAPIGKLSDHASGLAVDVNGIIGSGGLMAPQMAEGDPLHFEVGELATGTPVNLGHTEAIAEALHQKEAVDKLHSKFPQVSVQKGGVKFPTFSKTHELPNGASLIEYPDGVSTVKLTGSAKVPGKDWSAKFDYKTDMPTDVAKVVVGLEKPTAPDELPMIQQWSDGVVFCWHPEHGWMPAVAWDEAVSTAWEPTDDLFAAIPEPLIHPQAHLWCTVCDEHWMEHKGDPVACQSGGYLRPSTPLEDKRYIARQQMLAETGLK